MTRIMLAATLMLFLTIGAARAESATGDRPIVPAAGGGEEDHGKAEGNGHEKLELVRMKPILVQLPGPGGLRRSIAITLALELANPRDRDQIVEKRPKMRARIFEAWAASPLVASGEGSFDPEEARRRSRQVIDEIYGTGIVIGVLIEDIREILVR